MRVLLQMKLAALPRHGGQRARTQQFERFSLFCSPVILHSTGIRFVDVPQRDARQPFASFKGRRRSSFHVDLLMPLPGFVGCTRRAQRWRAGAGEIAAVRARCGNRKSELPCGGHVSLQFPVVVVFFCVTPIGKDPRASRRLLFSHSGGEFAIGSRRPVGICRRRRAVGRLRRCTDRG